MKIFPLAALSPARVTEPGRSISRSGCIAARKRRAAPWWMRSGRHPRRWRRTKLSRPNGQVRADREVSALHEAVGAQHLEIVIRCKGDGTRPITAHAGIPGGAVSIDGI